ncbi:hypothetical protein COCHEDRAFT_1222447 [Bipolaris maydis C5]|uniref:Uncharacterized protein n=1 Tax=Cochliobolus heterostrophus (strain C5 / ATCC 48332 / race O) TaxID=701091 RepID=M2TCN7_COCH5|nr:hypothetical protein COCHEDRAFT_1222447 [Bipolaris maydis C5]KAH7556172.1 hypothetical protein BM1_06698 [Bipolaris maydis]KAJ5021917.1 hypothetical protein J3E73DRAFT_434628 [Bipolaris maydis]KAJ6202961.1 hypothetical protein J3E72DRAFT_381413 [Bipolaris maydis]KAJ6214307.1 hypothetical protein PSV09DRAFT_1222447 [Bipolaris maydis]
MALPSYAQEQYTMAEPLQMTDQHTTNPSFATASSDMSTLGMPEVDSHLHKECGSQITGILDPADETADAAMTLCMIFGQPTKPPETPTIEHQEVLTHSHEDQRLLRTAESGSASIPPGKGDNLQAVVTANAYEAIACSISHVIEPSMEICEKEKPHEGQQAYPDDSISDPQGHPDDSIETSTCWDDAVWAFEHEKLPCDIIRDDFLDEGQTGTENLLGNQAIDKFLSLVEGFEMPGMGSPSNVGPRETSVQYKKSINMSDDATDLLKETRSSSIIRDHRSPSYGEPQEAPSAPTEQMEFLNGSVPITTDTINGEVIAIEDSTNASDISDSPSNITADQRPWADPQPRARSQTPIIIDTNNGEVIVIEDSSDSSDISDSPSNITADQRPWADPQPRARSQTPIIIDTNNGEAIVIEDSSDSSDISDSSDSASEITADRRTWAGSQPRVRFRPSRVLDGMVRWSDAYPPRTCQTAAPQLWIDAQNYWKSARAMKRFAGSKKVRKFDKIMVKAQKRFQQHGGTITVQAANKLHRKFKQILPHLIGQLSNSKQRKFLQDVDRTLKDLYTLVEVTAMMTEPPESDGDKDDGDYKPRGATRRV